MGSEFDRPPRRPVPHDGDVAFDPAACDLSDGFEIGTERLNLAPHPAFGACVRNHGRMELLRARSRRAPLEKANRVGATGYMLQAVAPQLAGSFGEISGLPVHRAGRLLHQDPRPIVAE